MRQHVWRGDIIKGEGRDDLPCVPICIHVREKTWSEPATRTIVPHDNPLQCCCVALGMMDFYLFSVLNIPAPPFDSSDGGMLNARILPFGSGTDENAIDLFKNMGEKEQEQLMTTCINQIKRDYPAVKDIKQKLHMMRHMSNLMLEVLI